jgi:Domain of unknown function (DUF4956)
LAKKEMEAPVQAGPRRLGRLTIIRLTVYYLVAGAVLLLLTALFPHHAMTPAGQAPVGMAEGLDWLRWRIVLLPTGAPKWVDACVQMTGALVLVLPLAFTYIRTRTRLKYDHSLVQTVVMLPIVVTAILVVVQDSLALAFSLAGIVAAVRFRNNLRESGDAVYIFGAIGIGFATGIHAITVGAMLSLFFVVVELALWKFNLGAGFDDAFNRLCMPSGAAAVVANPVGDVSASGGGNGRKRTPESLETDGRAVTLRIYTDEMAAARPAIERVLARDAKLWTASGAESGDGAAGVLEYRVRPRKRIGLDTLRDNLLREGAPHVIATDEALPAQHL